VTEDHLHFRHKITPYLGRHLAGQVRATFLRGRLIYVAGRFPAEPHGHECRVNKI
jgi:allantoinase